MQIFVFVATMFISACLLFVVQPMIGKMVLPDLGGSAAVWTTCMLFFQTILLCGYIYAHAITKKFSTRTAAIIHSVLAIAALPLSLISIHWVGDVISHPISSLLITLTISVGLPFFVISASAPLLQFIFSTTDAKSANDPYQLYTASNFGSLGALVSYPFLIEPMLGLTSQTWVWAGGYTAYILGILVCFRFAKTGKKEEMTTASLLTLSRRLRWLLWGFIPSSLMLGVTQYISTDIAPIPLLWLVPLSLYLVTFIIAFSNKIPKLPMFWPFVFSLCLLIPTYQIAMPIFWKVLIHTTVFFLIALYFHKRLADDRPPVDRLTEFFVILSIGGALGGLFNGVLAPFLFVQKLEYNIVLLVAMFALVPIDSAIKSRTFVSASLAGLVVGCLGACVARVDDWYVYIMLPAPFIVYAIMQLRFNKLWPVNLAVVVSIVAAVSFTLEWGTDDTDRARSFYSTYTVLDEDHQGRKTIQLLSGGTAHGEEVLDVPGVPFAYYANESCFGEVMNRDFNTVNVVGLGAGAAAAYAVEGSTIDFFEIDEAVLTLAKKHFSYLKRCGERCKVEIGDGRRLFLGKLDSTYDIIVLDAYNSDAVPTHLMTVEAMKIYLSKLKPNGVIAFHTSNRYLALESVLSSNAKALGLSSVGKICKTSDELEKIGPILSNSWVVVGDKQDLGYLIDGNWKFLKDDEKVWTDDFTNIASVFRWE